MSRKERFKERLTRIPVLSRVLVFGHRVLKLPSRVVYLVQNIEALQAKVDQLVHALPALQERSGTLVELVSSLHGKHDTALFNMDAIAADLRDLLPTLASRVDGFGAVLGVSSENLVRLHEKADRYAEVLRARIAANSPVMHAGDDLVIGRVDGFIMAFPAEEWRLPAYQIMAGDLEPGLVRMMKETVKEGMSVVDIGANVGTYTLLALRAIGSRGKVYSYEPTPRIFSILASNVQVNGFLETGRIDLRRKAVSDGTRTSSRFFMKRNSPTHNSLYASDDDHGGDVTAIDVETVSLDHDLGVEVRVDVVKIDAEGAEPAILRGMRGIIANNPDIVIFMEWAPQHLRRAGLDVEAYIDEVRGLGFDVYNVEEPTGLVEAVSDETLRNCFSLNLMLRRPR